MHICIHVYIWVSKVNIYQRSEFQNKMKIGEKLLFWTASYFIRQFMFMDEQRYYIFEIIHYHSNSQKLSVSIFP